ncbi:YggT family protein [Sphingomonas sp. HF-S3]|uniref:YggT family protein n=1 Tax=Sphingomonas rustica TaxID=3103142 RepID=A0ABV0B530_9SPHN
MLALIQILQILLNVLWWIIFVQVILSILISFNVVNMHNDFVRSLYTGLEKLTDPLYRPLRRILPDTRPLDFAPMAVLVIILILQTAIIPAIARAVL